MSDPVETTEGQNRAPNSSYSEPEIELGLQAVAVCAGNTRLAATLLRDQGTPIPRGTLEAWQRRMRERYQEIRGEVLPKIRVAMAEQAEDLALEYGRTEFDLLEQLREKHGELSAKDISNAMRNAATARGISTDKALVLRGDPNQITRADPAETLRALRELGIKIVDPQADVEGSAEEFEPELIEPGGEGRPDA